MKYRPSPTFIVALVIIILLSASAYMIGAIYFWQMATNQVPTVGTTDWRPDISHCFKPEETRELWDCIRHEES